jgi:hypothetical protein
MKATEKEAVRWIEQSEDDFKRDGRFAVLVSEAKKLDRFYIPT